MSYVVTPELAEALTRARRKRGWDIMRTKDECDLAYSTLSGLESAKRPGRTLNRRTLEKLSDGYGIPDDELRRLSTPTAQLQLEPSHGNGNGQAASSGGGARDLARIVSVWPRISGEGQTTLVELADQLAQ